MRPKPLVPLPSVAQRMERCEVEGILPSGEIVARAGGPSGQRFVCDFLENAANTEYVLKEGDRVLVLLPEGAGEKGCVLGKVGAYRKPDRKKVLLEAEEEVVIRCGQGSVTIRESGKVLVKGTEIVSHAKGANRIRGGSVQLN